jgi:phosphoserine phosphatase
MLKRPEVQTHTISDQETGFIESVLELSPRVAVFDCDGTLWAPDAGAGFFYWELDRHLVADDIIRWARPRYSDYRAGKVSEDDMCGEMVSMNQGLSEADLEREATLYFEERVVPQIFPAMQELVRRLSAAGCELWAVSSSNEWVIRAGLRRFGIPQERTLAAAVAIESGRATNRLLRVPSGPAKLTALESASVGSFDAAFGNSKWDRAMLERAPHPFAINPFPDLEKVAKEKGWPVFFPETQAEKAGSSRAEAHSE